MKSEIGGDLCGALDVAFQMKRTGKVSELFTKALEMFLPDQ